MKLNIEAEKCTKSKSSATGEEYCSLSDDVSKKELNTKVLAEIEEVNTINKRKKKKTTEKDDLRPKEKKYRK